MREVNLGGGGGGGHACGFLFNFPKVKENASITIKLLNFFHVSSDVAIWSENSPSLNCNIIDCYVILLISTFNLTVQFLHEAKYDMRSYADRGGLEPGG